MKYTTIEVPDKNDSLSRIVLNGTAYLIRFTYQSANDYWKFGIYTVQKEPVVIGVKIVPNFPLNLFWGNAELTNGFFGAKSNLERIGRNDFVNKKATFIFCPIDADNEG